MPSASGSTAGPAPWCCLPAKHLRMGLAIAVERMGGSLRVLVMNW
jgi:hypothetical protein